MMFEVKVKEQLLPDVNGKYLTGVTRERRFRHVDLMLKYIEGLLSNEEVIEITIRRCDDEEIG